MIDGSAPSTFGAAANLDRSVIAAEPAVSGSAPPPHPALTNIQALRAVAAILVVFVHLEYPLAQLGIGRSWQSFFAGGVDLFFVISGFIMVHTTARRSISPLAFLRLRIIRVVPLYWAITLCAFAVALVLPSAMQGTVADPVALFQSLFFIPFIRPDGLIRPILFVGWSLNLEMMFYLMFALTLFLRSPVMRVMCGVTALIALVALGKGPVGNDPVLAFMTGPMILEFGMGMILGLLFPHLPETQVSRSALIIGALAVAGLLLLPANAFITPIAIVATLTVLGALMLERFGICVENRTIIKIGDASYALYLTHPFVTQGIILIASAVLPSSQGVAGLTIAAALLASTLLAIAVHKWVEKPLGTHAARIWLPPHLREAR